MDGKPVFIKNKIEKWKILSYDEKDWCNAFQGQVLRFRKGYKTYKKSPYWEDLCEVENISMSEFFNISNAETEPDNWLYFDYKYMKDVLPETSEVLNDIKWSDFGLKNLCGKDSTMWIGNKGAHTPCHMDTYGCNLVAQILGRKLWILIPPEETDSLEPVRVPYEESSIYSSFNFYTPTSDLLRIKNALKIILHPGDMLFIPKQWWHYVENLDAAISVNVWIPQESDHERRLEEALVRHYVSKICQTLSEKDAMSVLNPNEYDLMSTPFSEDTLKLALKNCKKFREEISHEKFDEFKQFLKENGSQLHSFTEPEIKNYLDAKCHEHDYSFQPPAVKIEKLEKLTMSKMLINSYCHPKIVSAIKERLLKMNV